MEQHSFGSWLRLKRKALDLTPEALANRAGCSAATIRKLEAEERRPSAQIVERLAETFNIPTNERSKFLAFARGDWGSAPTETQENFPWRVSTGPSRSNLPATSSSLIGREKDVAAVHEYLLNPNIRLVTLIGPPGIGKTRLVLELGLAFLDYFLVGVFFVPLAPLYDPALIASTIVQMLGYVETNNHSVINQLTDAIADKQMLLVLDNCEHLIEQVAPLASELLSTCSRLKIIATSREALRIPGEWQYSISALHIPGENLPIVMETVSQFPALTLFVERARAVRSDFALNPDNVQQIAAICTQLDGLPLAIELIAARIRLMSPQLLLVRLNDQLTLYADGRRAVPRRQKTLYDAIAWSYDLLSQEEQELFARLSVFSGGFTVDAAESIFSRTTTNRSISDLIASLVDKSLLQRAIDDETLGEPRFNMLVTIQQFALDCLRRREAEAEVRNWHMAYFLEFAETADKEIHGPDQVEWINRLESEHENFRATLEQCVSNQNTEIALRLLGALAWSWTVRNHYSEMQRWFDQIRVLPEIITHPALYARLLNQMGYQNFLSGDYRQARSVLTESQAIWLKLGVDGERGLAESFYQLGIVALYGDADKRTSKSLFEKSLKLYQNCGDQWGLAVNTFRLGTIEADENHDDLALALLEQSLALFEKLGDLWGIARVSLWLGGVFLSRRNYEKARQFLEQHLRLDENLDFKQGIAVALANLGNLYRYQGDYEQAELYYGKSLSICYQYGLKTKGYNLYVLGLLALHRNNYPLAMQFFANYLNAARASAEKISLYEFLTGLAAIASGMDQSEHSARLYGAAQAISETIDYLIPKFDRVELDRHIQIAREKLGDTAFEALAAEGRAMTMEQAIDYALSITS